MIIDNEEYKDLTEYINDKTRQNMNSITYVGRIIAILFVIELVSIVVFFIITFIKFRLIINIGLLLLIIILSIITYSIFLSIINSIERNNQMIEVLHKINEKEKNTK